MCVLIQIKLCSWIFLLALPTYVNICIFYEVRVTELNPLSCLGLDALIDEFSNQDYL